MIVFVNGEFVDEKRATLSVFDRGFMYGDGCFETLRVDHEKPAFWEEHLQRLASSLDALQIPFEVNSQQLAQIARQLIRTNQLTDAVLRIQVTRGRGKRGYSIKGADQPSLIVSIHPAPMDSKTSPRAWKLRTSSISWDSTSPVTPHKSSNKLVQIMGKSEAERHGSDDVLFLTREGFVTETSTANLFWLDGNTLVTPPLSTGILPGITRQITLDLATTLGYSPQEKLARIETLMKSDALLLTQSVLGIIPVDELDGKRFDPHPISSTLQNAYLEKATLSPFPACQ